MIAVTLNRTEQMPVTSVILDRDPLDVQGNRVYMFHCSRCGCPVTQYQGDIISIMPGAVPHVTAVIAQCEKCKRRYLFRSIV